MIADEIIDSGIELAAALGARDLKRAAGQRLDVLVGAVLAREQLLRAHQEDVGIETVEGERSLEAVRQLIGIGLVERAQCKVDAVPVGAGAQARIAVRHHLLRKCGQLAHPMPARLGDFLAFAVLAPGQRGIRAQLRQRRRKERRAAAGVPVLADARELLFAERGIGMICGRDHVDPSFDDPIGPTAPGMLVLSVEFGVVGVLDGSKAASARCFEQRLQRGILERLERRITANDQACPVREPLQATRPVT